MSTRALSLLAMATAGLMLAHQVAGKAVRDATFLSVWPASALPTLVIATSVVAILAVPVYARLLATFGPRYVAPSGFLLSALAHALESQLASDNPWVAVAVYLHVAAFGALLLSGFWSLTSELFDPRAAKASYGRIAAAGTLGGLAGGLITAQLAGASASAPLLFLAVLHFACAGCVMWLGRSPSAFPHAAPEPAERLSGLFQFDALRHAPHLRTLALMVVTSTAGAAVIDFLLKAEAARPEHFSSRAELLQFFSVFYTVVQVLTFLVQSNAGAAVMRWGLGRTISTLPAGLGTTSAIGLLYPTFPVFVLVRATEAILRGSMFRSGYELLFVPMDPVDKRRTKTFLDVTCDRAGDALGALIVWLLLFTDSAFQKAELLAAGLALALGGLWLARRLDSLYLDVVERHLVKQGEAAPIVISSETGWSLIDLPVNRPQTPVHHPEPVAVTRLDDRGLTVLRSLRSGDREIVRAALRSLSGPTALETAQLIQLLAWDDVAPDARRVLENVASTHAGILGDALLDPATDFAIRRRIPRLLSTVDSDRALSALVHGLGDGRFEVRYQCARAIDRILARADSLSVPATAVLAAVDRELSVSPQIWQGHHLIDRLDGDEAADSPRSAERNLEHVFTLLAAVLPREPLQVAFRATQSGEPGLRALAIEYLESVLPADIRTKLWTVMEASHDSGRSAMAPETAFERLLHSTSAHPKVP